MCVCVCVCVHIDKEEEQILHSDLNLILDRSAVKQHFDPRQKHNSGFKSHKIILYWRKKSLVQSKTSIT